VNQSDDYAQYVQLLFSQFEAAQKANLFSIDYNRLQKYENFAQFMLIRTIENEEIFLKVDIVNDVAAHYGEFQQNEILGTVDSWENILSNKLAAVFRYEAKDIADIRIIAKHKQFDWMRLVQEAKTKEAAADPVIIFQILKSFPIDELSSIRWTTPVDFRVFKKDLDQIANDILNGNHNTLAILS